MHGAGSGSPAALLLLLGPVLAPALGPGRRDVLAAVLGTTAVLLAPLPLGTSSPVAADLPAALLLGPCAAGAAALAVTTSARRARRGAGEIDALREERSAAAAAGSATGLAALVAVAARGRPTAEPVARLSVVDTGVGIPADGRTSSSPASSARRTLGGTPSPAWVWA